MDIEFHYYILYLIAARAGYGPADSYKIAYSSQFVDNNVIFLEAAGSMFDILWRANHPNRDDEEMRDEKEGLLKDIGNAISAESSVERRKRYVELSEQEAYGGERIKEYDSYAWMTEVIYEDLRTLKSKGKHAIMQFLLNWLCNSISRFNKYTWSDVGNYKETDWFQFQEAAKEHQRESTDILNATKIGRLKLVNW